MGPHHPDAATKAARGAHHLTMRSNPPQDSPLAEGDNACLVSLRVPFGAPLRQLPERSFPLVGSVPIGIPQSACREQAAGSDSGTYRGCRSCWATPGSARLSRTLTCNRDGDLLFTLRMGNLIGRAATLAGLPPPRAATNRHRGGLEEPFAVAVVCGTTLERQFAGRVR